MKKIDFDAEALTIGKAARKTGIKVETIRYYERIGLIPEPKRSEGGNRLYDLDLVKRLSFIKRCRELGFSLDVIREFLRLVEEHDYSCSEIADLSKKHLQSIKSRIKDLKKIQSHLEDILKLCSSNDTPRCAFIDILYKE